MPANFLIVCGGVGRGILSRFDELGFDGALQIDVQSELVQVRDGRVQTFGLPVSRVVETPPTTHVCLTDYQMRLDYAWQTVHQTQGHDGVYAQCQEEECATYRRQIQHAAIVRESIVDQEFAAGVPRTPLVARAYMTRPLVTRALGEQLQKMLSMRTDASDIAVWLVASTCGGTGNGIVHHVADVVRQVFRQYQLTIKFVRIGGWSYQSIDHLAKVSTCWAVLTDFGYRRTYSTDILKQIRAGLQPSYTSLEFYYLEVPDVGGNVHERESLVQSAFVAISNPTINKEFFIFLINRAGGVVMARVGEWGNALNKDAVYLLTLRQLAEKMEHLLSKQDTVQSYSRWLAETTDINIISPITVATTEMTQRYSEVSVKPAMRPILQGLGSIRPDAFGSTTNVLQVQQHPKWQEMRQLVLQIFTETEIRNIERQVQVNLTIEGQIEGVNLGDHADAMGPMYIASRDHIGRVQMAQRAKARMKHYLLGDTSTDGCIKTGLRETWNALIPPAQWGGLFVDDTTRQTAFTSGIVKFLTEYFKVARCLALYNEAEQIIQNAKKDFSNVTDAIRHEVANSENVSIPHQYTECAELDDMFGGAETWLRMLLNKLQGELIAAIASGEFRVIVELGANGLTDEGLRYILQVNPQANSQQIVEAVNRSSGTNGAVWWQGMPQPVMWHGAMGTNYWFNFRIFPRLPGKLFADLQTANTQWEKTANQFSPRFLSINSTALGLKVYAVQCACPAPANEESSQIQQLVMSAMQSLTEDKTFYMSNATGTFDSKKYRQVQCSRSHGITVRIPAALSSNPAIAAVLKTAMSHIEDCFIISDEDANDEALFPAENIGGA